MSDGVGSVSQARAVQTNILTSLEMESRVCLSWRDCRPIRLRQPSAFREVRQADGGLSSVRGEEPCFLAHAVIFQFPFIGKGREGRG